MVLILCTQTALADSDGWESVGAGIQYQEFHLSDPNNVYVARMERSNPLTTLDSGIANGMLAHGTETVSEMAQRYDGALNTWGGAWINRNKVVVAINGSFFYTPSGSPMSGLITSGWYAKRFDDLGGGSGFAWKMDRSVFIGKCVYHRPEKQLVTYLDTGVTQRIDGVNTMRAADRLILYTPQFGATTGTNEDGVEVVVELTSPTTILPYPAKITGVIRSVRNGQASASLYFDEVALSGQGAASRTLLDNAHVGAEIGISQELTHLQNDCSERNPDSWTKTYASLNGSFELLLNGIVQKPEDPGATARHPRTAIAYNDEYIFFIVVDGRSETSIGMTIPELARFARDTLGATWGLAQDGGGSSTMVVNGQVKNHPSDPCYRVYLPLVLNGEEQPGSESAPYEPSVLRSSVCERAVANSMMMVVVEPEQKSEAFAPGNLVKVVAPSSIRLGPGTNYSALAVAPKKVIGIVQPDLNNLGGIYAKGTYWWYVDFGRVTGWVDQQTIVFINPLRMEISPFR
jgi:hypothetical protein